MKKLIAFVTGGLDFNGNSLNEKALGGSESAMIYMAQELSMLGNIVYVYCNCEKPGLYDGVNYCHKNDFKLVKSKTFDVLVISRAVEYVPPNLVSNLTIFWMHDTYMDNFPGYTHLQDKIFLLSEFQKSLYVNANKNFDEMIHITSNGFDRNLAAHTKVMPFQQKKNTYIYASRPERGLDFLLTDIWPGILEINPNAVLHICSYENKNVKDDTKLFYDKIDELIANSTNVVKLGNLIKSQFYNVLGQCGFMVYPCDYPETSCIAAIEAQALQCLVITSDAFALTETVQSPTKVTGKTVEEYKSAFLAKVAEYQNEELYNKTIYDAGVKVWDKYPWDVVANSWDNYFNKMFTDRYKKYAKQIFKRLGHTSDYVTLSKVDHNFNNLLFEQFHANNFDYSYNISLTHPDTPKSMLDDINEVRCNTRQAKMVEMVSEHIEKQLLLNPYKKFTILELGCYDGPLSGTLYKKYTANISKVYAYDGLQDALLAYHKIWSKNPGCDNIELICDNISNLANHAIKADIILVGELLEHLVDYKTALNDIQQCANTDALVMFSTPVGPWSCLLQENRMDTVYTKDIHVHHYEMLDLFTIFDEYRKDNNFFITYIPITANHRNEVLGNYIFGYVFKETKSFNEYDPIIKALKMRPYFSISTCMIVKNGENDLFRCLNSVKEMSDEIVIVDTGSTDRSKSICELFTKNIYDLKWEEDDGYGSFERARNYSVEKASGDYIFYIDADEELQDGHALANFTRSEYIYSYGILQKQIMLEQIDGHDQFPNRLFRKGKLQFYGVIHELPRQDPVKDNEMMEITLPHSTRLDHYGYVTHQIRSSKKNRNYELLLKNIAKYPELIDNYFYHVRDMIFFFYYTQDIKYLKQAVEVWKTYPTLGDSHRQKVLWIDAAKLMQTAFTILEEKDDLVVIKKKISKTIYRFLSNKELKQFQKIIKSM